MEHSQQSKIALDENKRAWLSLAVVIHFFILSVSLWQNNGASYLVKRIGQMTSAYSILTHQDYGARPLEMTTGGTRSWPHHVQVQHAGSNTWSTIEPSATWPIQWLDRRWPNFQHMLAVAANENNEDLIYLIFEKFLQQAELSNNRAVSIRLIRASTLSFAQDQLYRDGKLPATDLEDSVLYEAKVIRLADDSLRLLPVLEPTRRAASLEANP